MNHRFKLFSDDLLTKTVYKIEAKPQAVIYPHNPRVSFFFLKSKFSKISKNLKIQSTCKPNMIENYQIRQDRTSDRD